MVMSILMPAFRLRSQGRMLLGLSPQGQTKMARVPILEGADCEAPVNSGSSSSSSSNNSDGCQVGRVRWTDVDGDSVYSVGYSNGATAI
jgi:hypothetical protein